MRHLGSKAAGGGRGSSVRFGPKPHCSVPGGPHRARAEKPNLGPEPAVEETQMAGGGQRARRGKWWKCWRCCGATDPQVHRGPPLPKHHALSWTQAGSREMGPGIPRSLLGPRQEEEDSPTATGLDCDPGGPDHRALGQTNALCLLSHSNYCLQMGTLFQPSHCSMHLAVITHDHFRLECFMADIYLEKLIFAIMLTWLLLADMASAPQLLPIV